MHVYDPRFAALSPIVEQATVADYRKLQALTGTCRAVVVQPRPYGTDNRLVLDAIASLGAEHTRGVAVVRPDVSDTELLALHAGGIRGIRFSLYTPAHAAVGFEMVEPLAHRVAALGWHLQLHWTAAQIVAHGDMLRRLPAALVFDHLARLPMPGGTAHPAFDVVRGLLEGGNAWVKLSGAYLDSQDGEAGRYADMGRVARAWVHAAPERIVWGSDWPHVTEVHKPDDALLFDLLGEWAGAPDMRERILVANPAVLYGFV
jgi:D-galactarolactone isomerase